MDAQQSHLQNIIDWRRYGHWDSSANKARLSAFLLWQTHEPAKLAALQDDADYSSGDADLALTEGFRRESAVALELIIKAVIAKKMELRYDPNSERVPATHDIPALWQKAELPELDRQDKYRLHLFKSILNWSGRYATPKTAKAWAEENREFSALDDPALPRGKIVFTKPILTDWEDFDRLFQMAQSRLRELRVRQPPLEGRVTQDSSSS
jgi:hypothetical protein